MVLDIPLTNDLEERLHQEAVRRGISPDEATLKILDEHLPHSEQRVETIALLQSWIDDDEDEDADYDLFQALDAARTSDRKLFPLELKGVSW